LSVFYDIFLPYVQQKGTLRLKLGETIYHFWKEWFGKKQCETKVLQK